MHTGRAFDIAALWVCAALGAPCALAGGQGSTPSLEVTWADGCRSLSFAFLGETVRYPGDMLTRKFPPPGAEPEIAVEKKWPVVAMTARWSVSADGWPEKYRKDAVDLITMYACDAALYENIYPAVISSSAFTSPPEFLKEAQDARYDLAGVLRGKEVGYEVTAKAGFAAADYTIRTRIRIGVSVDEATIFYHDRPEYISAYVTSRDFFFAGRDAGRHLDFEVRMLSVCAPTVFQGEAMRRVEKTGRYFVKRLHDKLDRAPTTEKIESYMEAVKKGARAIE